MAESPVVNFLRANADMLLYTPGRTLSLDRELILGMLAAQEEWEREHPGSDPAVPAPPMSKEEAATALGRKKSAVDTLLKANLLPGAYRRSGTGPWCIPADTIAARLELERTYSTPTRRAPRTSQTSGQPSSAAAPSTRPQSNRTVAGADGTSPSVACVTTGHVTSRASTSVRITTAGDGLTSPPGFTIDVTSDASSEHPAGNTATDAVPRSPAPASMPVSRVTGAAAAPEVEPATGSAKPNAKMTTPRCDPLTSPDAVKTSNAWDDLLPETHRGKARAGSSVKRSRR